MTERGAPRPIRLALAGDVMTGRGIDQVLAHPCDPVLHEPWVHDARVYVQLAEERNGPIPAPVDDAYVWGAALSTLEQWCPDARIINLETSITVSDDHWADKGIHYRMSPRNIGCIAAAGIDCCVLANNHVVDWGFNGLDETLRTLATAGIAYTGAGRDRTEAGSPAVIDLGDRGRVLVFAFCDETSGTPVSWSAGAGTPGVNLLRDLTRAAAQRIATRIADRRRAGDIVVASVHWGGNWGYEVPPEQASFARALIDSGAVDVVHGHSSHHPKGIERYRGKTILYGCGDLLNDYEGISGHESYRGDLSLLYCIDIDPVSRTTLGVAMAPFRIERFRLTRAAAADARWLAATLEGESAELRIECHEGPTLIGLW